MCLRATSERHCIDASVSFDFRLEKKEMGQPSDRSIQKNPELELPITYHQMALKILQMPRKLFPLYVTNLSFSLFRLRDVMRIKSILENLRRYQKILGRKLQQDVILNNQLSISHFDIFYPYRFIDLYIRPSPVPTFQQVKNQ